MLEDFYISHIRRQLPFVPNAGQEALLRKIALFLLNANANQCFILRGYAGTGKTSVVAALTRAMQHLRQPFVLLAPTGRAAKVLSHYSGFPAYTIHKKIYRARQMGSDDFGLGINLRPNTLFIIDEASMIGNRTEPGNHFGSGDLLSDLVRYVYATPGCRLLLLGDDAQLPPVGQSFSPALHADTMRGYGLDVTEHILTEVARQALDSCILRNATHLRELLSSGKPADWSTLEFAPDFRRIEGNEVQLLLEEAYRDVGEEETIFLTRTNRRTNIYNNGIRGSILFQEEELSAGDRLMVTRNNYFWLREDDAAFIANGDMFTVTRLRNHRTIYDFRFVDAHLRSEDYEWEIEATLWLDTLTADSPDAAYRMQRTLFERIAEDYPELQHKKRDLIQKIMASPYYNALQVRYAYCVTGHKAQGGQWQRIFIDPAIATESLTREDGSHTEDGTSQDFLRWFYTAITRSRSLVYLVSFPLGK